MWLRLVIALNRIRPRRILRRIRFNWPYLALLVLVVLPLYWMAAALAWRSDLFSFFGGTPTSEQLTAFLTFIGGGLATAVTMYGALLTHAHNARERKRLQLQAVLQSLDTLPAGEVPERVSAVFPAMVLLGQQRVALRALNPAVQNGVLDIATATWVIDQVLMSADNVDPTDGERVDVRAVIEAAVLLYTYAEKGMLTAPDTANYYFADYFMEHWSRTLPHDAKMLILRAIAHTLLSRGKDYWTPRGELPDFPTRTLVECARHDFEPVVRATAAVLLETIAECIPRKAGERKRELRRSVEDVLRKRKTRAANERVLVADMELALRIREKWSQPDDCRKRKLWPRHPGGTRRRM